MNGGLALRRPPFPSNALFVFLTRVNLSNTSFRIVFKLGGRGDRPPILCMNFVVLDPTIMIVLIGSKLFLGN